MWSFESIDKLNTLCLHLKKFHRQQSVGIRRPLDVQRTSDAHWQVRSYLNRLPALSSHDLLITWPTKVTWRIEKKYILTFTRLMGTNLDRVLTLERRFKIQTFMSSPISCIYCVSEWTAKSLLHFFHQLFL